MGKNTKLPHCNLISGTLDLSQFVWKLAWSTIETLSIENLIDKKNSSSTSGFTGRWWLIVKKWKFSHYEKFRQNFFFGIFFSAKILKIFSSFVWCAYQAIPGYLKMSDFEKFWKKIRQNFENFENYFFRILRKK